MKKTKNRIKLIILAIGLLILTLPKSYAIEDTRLESLKLTPEGTGLSPAFSGDSYQYELTVENDITSIEVEAKAKNPQNKVQITGNSNLEEGSNLVKVTVTANQQEYSSYSIFVTRKSPSIQNVDLIPNVIEENPNKKLQVTGIILDETSNLFIHPEYNPNVHDYTLELKGEATSIPLTVAANKEEANIEIKGNENLKDGKNIIKIKVMEGQEKLEYTLVVYKNIEGPKAIEANAKPTKEQKTIGMVILVTIVILIIGLVWKKRKNKN